MHVHMHVGRQACVKSQLHNLNVENVLFNHIFNIFLFMVISASDTYNKRGMNECLTIPQQEKQIGYWVSEKGKCMKWL